MAKKQSQKKRPQKQKIEWRRVFVAGLAVVMALLLLLPMISMIAGGVGAVTQSEIDALKEEQRESQVKQQELKNHDNQVMEELTAARQELERLQAELESARAEEQAAKDQQEAKKAEQQAKVAEAQKLLDQINADAAELNRQLDDEMEGAAEIQAEIARKQKQLEEERRQNNVTIDSETNYLWPLPGYYRLTSLFGYRIHPITGKAHSHTGIDIPAPGGTPIQACKSGQVVTSAYHYSYGNYVVIDHGNGNSTLYAHMSSRAVSEGQMVSQGQTIGYVGTTGSSTGNHLHLEVRDNYTRVDPESKFPSLSLTHPW